MFEMQNEEKRLGEFDTHRTHENKEKREREEISE